jgi:DNA-binding winged helix-turn-helix (wHTH) protein
MISFGPFDANLHTQELRKHGLPLRLPSQSFQILKILVVKPGQLVTREELQEALWPSDTFVDFEHGVNAAVSRLREVLGDSADSPQLIETLPRRGYRFIGTITKQPDVPSVPVESGEIAAESSAPVPAKAGTDDRLNWLKIGVRIVVVAACVFAAVFAYLRLRPRAEQAALAPVPFTALPGLELYPTFSPDGSQIAFAWNGDPSSGSKGFDLYAKGIGGESLLRLTSHPSEWLYPSWSPDGAQIAFHRISGADTGVYVIPALGGPEHGPRGLVSRHEGTPEERD